MISLYLLVITTGIGKPSTDNRGSAVDKVRYLSTSYPQGQGLFTGLMSSQASSQINIG